MRMVRCYECGKRYDYDEEGFCPKCGAFNQPAKSNGGSIRAASGDTPASPAGKKRTADLQRELGENLRQMEKAMNKLLQEQPRGRRLPGGDL